MTINHFEFPFLTEACSIYVVNPVYYGHLGTMHPKYPADIYQGVLVIYMIKSHLGLQLSVWIMQISLFSSAHVNRFHCKCIWYPVCWADETSCSHSPLYKHVVLMQF